MSRCIDCPEGSRRPVKGQDRCATHLREKVRKQKDRAADSRRAARFGMTGSTYRELANAQDGACGCGRVPGDRSKRLAVDHDHAIARDRCTHDPEQGCPRCIRGLLEHGCNDVLAYFRDDPQRLRRLADYLENPPARQVFRP